ncbi:CBS domain-containing protein [Candidatus Nanohalobium constans]|uniref:CBS domain containing protein n=1 Tax=Candidatus Nanohalobium constans TaxID=2565781 RepID=A0A5Q0UH46_9ARCH|nr:CBS domain-containing protein [Candidatus Nanohalobium constans]QGA80958.1 CBS domain containing protein [Candidatus Nanohalobium constans]
MLTARELMDEPDFIRYDAGIDEVVDELNDKENTLIVRRDGEFVGEIHEQSLLKVLIPEDRLDEEKVIGILGLSFDQRYVAENAEDIMNEHEVTVSPDEETGEIAFLMDREDLRSVPVVEDDEVIGVVHENRLIEEIH